MRIVWLVAVLICVSLDTLFAQSFYSIRRERSVIASFGTGTATYFGDLKGPGVSMDVKPSLNVGLQYFLNSRISVRSELTWFHLSGSDANSSSTDRKQRNLSFFSDNYELNATGLINLFPNKGGRYYRRVPINFYGFAGVGLAYINPKTTYQGKSVALQPLKTEGVSYSRFQFVIPYGLGMRIKQGPYMNISIEGGLRKTFTDHLDDVSVTRYPDPATLSSDLSRALSDRRQEYNPEFVPKPGLGKRGNPANNDSYFLLNIKIEYYLPYDIRTSSNRKFKIFNPRRTYDFNKRRYRR
jgi:hypothetical protein